MNEPTHSRDSRRATRLIFAIGFFLFIPLCYVLYEIADRGARGIDLGGPVPSLLFAGQYAFIGASVVPAALLLRTGDRRRSWRLAGWMALLLLVGVGFGFAVIGYVDHRDSVVG
jgi:hypothetical protein